MLFDNNYVNRHYLNESVVTESSIFDGMENEFDKIDDITPDQVMDLFYKLNTQLADLVGGTPSKEEVKAEEESVYCMLNARDYVTESVGLTRSVIGEFQTPTESLIEMLQDCTTYDQVLEVAELIHEEALKYRTAEDIKKTFEKIKKMDFSKEDDTRAATSIIVGLIVGIVALCTITPVNYILGLVTYFLSIIVGQKAATYKNKYYAINKIIQATEKQGAKLKKKYDKETDPEKKKQLKEAIAAMKQIHNEAQKMGRNIRKEAQDQTLKSKKFDV